MILCLALCLLVWLVYTCTPDECVTKQLVPPTVENLIVTALNVCSARYVRLFQRSNANLFSVS